MKMPRYTTASYSAPHRDIASFSSPAALQKLGRALSSVTVLPEQWDNSPHHAHRTRGEVASMAAVFDSALNDFQQQFVKRGRRAQRLAREAEE